MAKEWGYNCDVKFNEKTQDFSCVIKFNGEKYKMLNNSLANISRFINEFYTSVVLVTSADSFEKYP